MKIFEFFEVSAGHLIQEVGLDASLVLSLIKDLFKRTNLTVLFKGVLPKCRGDYGGDFARFLFRHQFIRLIKIGDVRTNLAVYPYDHDFRSFSLILASLSFGCSSIDVLENTTSSCRFPNHGPRCPVVGCIPFQFQCRNLLPLKRDFLTILYSPSWQRFIWSSDDLPAQVCFATYFS